MDGWSFQVRRIDQDIKYHGAGVSSIFYGSDWVELFAVLRCMGFGMDCSLELGCSGRAMVAGCMGSEE